MQREFRLKTIGLALMAAFPLMPAWAAEPYPPLPPTLSTSVTPNILLHIDNSGSMANAPPSGGAKSKMTIAKEVATSLVDSNQNLRWGVFSFNPSDNDTGGLLQSAVGLNIATVKSAISNLSAATWTPLGEAAMEMSRYWSGSSSYYRSGVTYTSPIQYRCQKNFNIIITDGFSTKDNELPGLGGRGAESYQTFNSAGEVVNKSFKVCNDTSTISSVTCPAKLEGSAINNPFVGSADDASTYGRSLRDVVMMMADRDMRTSGNDSDGKDFNDPMFPKQNVLSFTIGFAVDDPVLKASAIVGGGTYAVAGNQTELLNSLNNVVASIGDMTSNAGGLAVKSTVVGSGNKFFQPVFNPKGWYGELRCFNNNGTVGNNDLGSACTPYAKAQIPSAASRKIFSSKVAGQVTTSFDFTTANLTTMTGTQQSLLGSSLNSALEQKNVINYIRGDETISGYRVRSNGLLGDIIDSQPMALGAPVSVSTDLSYETFRQANANRGIVFIGANDGMLHAFRMSDMTEIMGYVPSSVYRNLKVLKELNYGESGGAPHVYHVNGEMRKADVKLGGAWRTLLVGGLAQGGQGYFALDATNETALSTKATVKWEWTDVRDSDMGYSFPTPLIYNVRTSDKTAVPAVILANGYENNFDDVSAGGQKAAAKSSALYVINAETGVLIKKISVPTVSYTSQGLSSPAGLDIGQDGVLDYVYAGDINGNLWRFDLTASSPDAFTVSSAPLFQAGKPITTRPAILHITKKSDDSSLGHMIFFGTGKLHQDSDRSDTATQTVYGILDSMSSPITTVSSDQLVGRIKQDEATVNGVNYRLISGDEFDIRSDYEKKKGWFLNLTESTERLVTSPFLLPDRLLFGTGIPKAAEACIPGGKGWVMGLNPLTGLVTKSKYGQPFSFIDVNGDKRSSEADKINFAGGKAFANGFQIKGIPTELTWLANSSTNSMPSGGGNSGLGDAGGAIALDGANAMGVFTGGKPSGSGVTTGNPIGRPSEGGDGGGQLCVGSMGSANVTCGTSPSGSNAVKMETTLWREIKQ